MRRAAAAAVVFLACLTVVYAASAQEGHPLTGTWAGDWGPSAADRTRVTIVMSWDGKTVSGLIDPGPNAVPIGSVFVDWATWTVRLEADGKDSSGQPVRISAEGRLEDIGSYHRRIVGTWTQGGVKGDLRLTRD